MDTVEVLKHTKKEQDRSSAFLTQQAYSIKDLYNHVIWHEEHRYILGGISEQGR